MSEMQEKLETEQKTAGEKGEHENPYINLMYKCENERQNLICMGVELFMEKHGDTYPLYNGREQRVYPTECPPSCECDECFDSRHPLSTIKGWWSAGSINEDDRFSPCLRQQYKWFDFW